MIFLNEFDISDAVERYRSDPVLGPAARFLESFKDEVNAHSDGWPYWSAPVKAAAKLQTLVQRGAATREEVIKAIAPIKSFITRRGAAAGIVLPKLDL